MTEISKASFNVDSQTLNTFRVLVAQKYGRLYGVLEKEFTHALNDRIAELKKEQKAGEAPCKATPVLSNNSPTEKETIAIE